MACVRRNCTPEFLQMHAMYAKILTNVRHVRRILTNVRHVCKNFSKCMLCTPEFKKMLFINIGLNIKINKKVWHAIDSFKKHVVFVSQTLKN